MLLLTRAHIKNNIYKYTVCCHKLYNPKVMANLFCIKNKNSSRSHTDKIYISAKNRKLNIKIATLTVEIKKNLTNIIYFRLHVQDRSVVKNISTKTDH